MSAFGEACSGSPFSNNTDGGAWTAAWCDHCANDHGMHGDDPAGPGCSLVLVSMLSEWPEGWIPEPDDGAFHLPPRIICTAFVPCEPCGGDPGAEERAVRVAEVVAYWQQKREP